MTPKQTKAPIGLYVHFPFCVSICPYCDFVVYGGRAARGPASQVERLVAALIAEIRLRAPGAAAPPLATVYLGGGTPSLMTAQHVERLLAEIDAGFGIAAAAEVTIEVNPGPDERGDLAAFRAAGVNRVSIGAQSLGPAELRRLGRRHSPSDVASTVKEARRAGFDNLSLDLLYDIPGQTLDSWRRTLRDTLALAPEHVSAYSLSLDDPDSDGLTGTLGDHLPLRPGARRWRKRALIEQDVDRAADCYELADDLLSEAGLGWYEISNWARPGRQSRHNLIYWSGGAWEAVGPGAHAFDGWRTRRWNAARLDAYLSALASGRLPPGGKEATHGRTATAELAMLRLRTREGLPLTEPGRDEFAEGILWALANGMAHVVGNHRLTLTRRGRQLSNEVFLRLLPAPA